MGSEMRQLQSSDRIQIRPSNMLRRHGGAGRTVKGSNGCLNHKQITQPNCYKVSHWQSNTRSRSLPGGGIWAPCEHIRRKLELPRLGGRRNENTWDVQTEQGSANWKQEYAIETVCGLQSTPSMALSRETFWPLKYSCPQTLGTQWGHDGGD